VIRRIALFLGLGLLPLAAGLAVLPGHRGAIPPALAGVALGLAGGALLLLGARRKVRDLASAALARERTLLAQREELQGRVEFLSALREISLILNEDVDFRNILDRVLAIACETLGGRAEVWMPSEGKLVRRAARTGEGKTQFEFEGTEDPRVRQCYRDGRILVEAEEGRFHALAPLQADREIIGVVRISTTLEDSPQARQERAKVLVRHLEEISKFLALAVKTPDLYTRAVEDGLTGLWTKRHFLSQIELEIESSSRYGDPLSLIMVDVDHFKKVNDAHGHPTGDRVLRGVAEILKKRVRGGSAFRYGGEEMAVLLPKADLPRAVAVAERLRKAIEAHKIGGVKVTASFGVCQAGGDVGEGGVLVERADQALYRAKEAGRNRVCAAPPPEEAQKPSRPVSRSA
jgi:diguanylate cyclase (GGDEF)-like protein